MGISIFFIPDIILKEAHIVQSMCHRFLTSMKLDKIVGFELDL